MRKHKIAAIGGDGIGPEVTAAGCRVLEAAAAADGGFGLEFGGSTGAASSTAAPAA